jgi:hypothetical protein
MPARELRIRRASAGTDQRQLTTPPGLNLLANGGVLRVHLHKQ